MKYEDKPRKPLAGVRPVVRSTSMRLAPAIKPQTSGHLPPGSTDVPGKDFLLPTPPSILSSHFSLFHPPSLFCFIGTDDRIASCLSHGRLIQACVPVFAR